MDNKIIATFVKVVEFNNFTKAANELGYSQATVTGHIKLLEGELGVPLFDRIGKRIALTQAGRDFLPFAINMLKAEEDALNSVKASDELEGQLHICAGSSYSMKIMPNVLIKFLAIHPKVKVKVKVSDFVEDTMARLSRGETDFVVCLEEEQAYQQFEAHAKRAESMAFVTYPENSLCMKHKLKLSDLKDEAIIVADSEIGYWALLREQLEKRGIRLMNTVELGSVAGILEMLSKGYGSSYLPRFTVEDQLRSGELVELEMEEISCNLYSFYASNRNRWLNPVMREFIRVVDEYNKER